MDGSPDSAVDRLIHGLCACVLFLTVLFLWRRTHERSCLALAFPLLTVLAIFGGLLEYRLERKRFVVDYYLDRASSMRRWLRGSGPSVMISLAAALPLAAFLVVFVARSRPTDWLFLSTAAVMAPLLFSVLSTWPGRHFRRDAEDGLSSATIADVLVARMAGTLLLGGLAVAYVYASYYLIPAPGQDIFPDSLERTIEAFSGHAGSACSVTDDTLRLATQIEGLSWHFVTTAAMAPWMHDGIGTLLWVGFFLNAAMVFGGFVRGLEGAILLTLRLVRR